PLSYARDGCIRPIRARENRCRNATRLPGRPGLARDGSTIKQKSRMAFMSDSVRSASGSTPWFRPADFATLPEALDFAARGKAGLSFYSGRGALVEHLAYE